MHNSLYLAWQYLKYNRLKTVILVASLTLIVFLPAALQVLIESSARQLRARAARTPLIIGARGSPLELVLNSLYFETAAPPHATMHELQRVEQSSLAQAIPLYVRFHVQQFPIVGTTLDYFGFRGLELAQGRPVTWLGECVAGHDVARGLGLAAGSAIVSSPETLFDLAGAYPLKLHVVGVLAPSGGPDDRAIFVDLKTSWIIEGLGHGHQDLAQDKSQQFTLERHGNEVTANAAVEQFQEITPENVGSFHFHGDPATFPVTAVLAVPRDEKSGVLLRGRYQGQDEPMQILEPAAVMEELLGTVFRVRQFVVAALLLVAVATLAACGLVIALSLRLRQRELATMNKIGCSRGKIASLVGCEIGLVVLVSLLLAAGLTWVTARFAEGWIRWMLV